MSKPPTYHVIRSIPSARLAGEYVPVIIILDEDGTILKDAFEFFHDERYSGKSQSWRASAAKTIGLFFDLYKATDQRESKSGVNKNILVNNFLLALYNGTIQPDGQDELGLRWRPIGNEGYSSRKAYLKTFIEALEDLNSEGIIFSTRFTMVTLSSKAHEYRKNRSLLLHINRPRDTVQNSRSSRFTIGKVGKGKPFPPEALVKLIGVGCRKQRSIKDFYDRDGKPTLASEFNLNLLMAILLMAGAGIRKSEIFHIFFYDVEPETVWMYDPERGKDRTGKLRTEHIQETTTDCPVIGCQVRNMQAGKDFLSLME